MNFGEKFRTEHSSLSGSMSKSELDTYAEKLESKINEATFDKEHDTVFVKNSTLTKQQIDYLQLKLNIHIYRLDQEKIGLNPFEHCDIEACEIETVNSIAASLSSIAAILFSLLASLSIPMSLSETTYITRLLCVFFLAVLICIGGFFLLNDIIFNYKNKRYIKTLQESNEI